MASVLSDDYYFFQVTFNFPLGRTPDKSAFVMELSDGTVTSPVCFHEELNSTQYHRI